VIGPKSDAVPSDSVTLPFTAAGRRPAADLRYMMARHIRAAPIAGGRRHLWSMIPKSGNRFSEKIMLIV
jgi:hypothetical protein